MLYYQHYSIFNKMALLLPSKSFESFLIMQWASPLALALIQQFERRSFTEVATKPKRIDGNHPMVKDAKAAAKAWGSPPQALPG